MEFAVAAANRTLFAVIGRTAQYLYIALACKDLYNVMVGKMIMSLLEPLSQQDYKALYVVPAGAKFKMSQDYTNKFNQLFNAGYEAYAPETNVPDAAGSNRGLCI